jgi:hypothetical protein
VPRRHREVTAQIAVMICSTSSVAGERRKGETPFGAAHQE